jgi:hypothetical protein
MIGDLLFSAVAVAVLCLPVAGLEQLPVFRRMREERL